MLTKSGKAMLFLTTTDSSIPVKLKKGPQGGPEMDWLDRNRLAECYAAMDFAVGSGTTAPTADDAGLENEISTLTRISFIHSAGSGIVYDNDCVFSAAAIYKNSTDSDITISEIGIYGQQPSMGSTYGPFLFAREVIEPVTIHPGESYTFSMLIG